MYINDGWKYKKAEILELYLKGKTPGMIAGLTGVPRIRIQHELEHAIGLDPRLEAQHLESARYPSRRNRDIDPVMLCV